MIAIEVLHDFFARNRALFSSGTAAFDIDASCRWSYFFIDSDRDKLTAVGRALEGDGYEVIGFLEPGPGDDDQETIYLRADRVEAHTVESLHRRNGDLSKVARDHSIRDYDGMDVGPGGGG